MGAPAYQSLALFIDLLGYNQYQEAMGILAEMLRQSENEEVIIHVFKALARIQLPVDMDLTSFLHHQSWVIRSQAAKYLSTIASEDYIEDLHKLLTDENWWVRFHAGKALLNFTAFFALKWEWMESEVTDFQKSFQICFGSPVS